MKNQLPYLLLALLMLILSGRVSAQQASSNNLQNNTITTAVPFLMISGNGYEMGAANMGVVSSSFYHETAFTSNPALLANGHRYAAVNHSYVPWLRALVPDLNLQAHSWAGTINNRNALGLYFKHFDLGTITFTDASGSTLGDVNPQEYVLQLNYAHWFPFGLSLGVAGKYIHSNLTGGINVGGADTKPAQAGALDFGLSYRTTHKLSESFSIGGTFGLAFNNMGNKVSYTNTTSKDFLPMNMMIGAQLNLCNDHGAVRTEHDIGYQATKLLVPTPPTYDDQPYLDNLLPPGDTIGALGHPSNANPTFGSIVSGQDPNVGVFQGMFRSFNDAPGGTEEEWNEVMHQVAHETRLIVKDVFMIGFRQGFFYEHKTKGNRQFVALGGAIGGAGFRLDLGGWIPLEANHPLQNTFYATVSYRILLEPKRKKMRYPKWNPNAYAVSANEEVD